MVLILAQLIGYFVGGIPFGYLIARAKAGIDIRDHGSGNIGATNVGRVLGFRFFLLVFVLDFLKGALPVGVGLYLRVGHGGAGPAMAAPPPLGGFFDAHGYLFVPELIGFGAILGHVFPIYLRMRGGKGVATAMGVLVMLAPVPTLVGLIAFAIAFALCRMVSASSITFAITLALSYLAYNHYERIRSFSWSKSALTSLVLGVATLIVARHRSNVVRILQGREPRAALPWRRDKPPGPSAGA